MRVRVIQRKGAWWIDYYYLDETGALRRKYEKIGPGRKFAETVAAKRRVEILEGKFLDRRRFKPITFAEFVREFEDKHMRFLIIFRHGGKQYLRRLVSFFGARQLMSISQFDAARFKVHFMGQKTRAGNLPAKSTFNRYLSTLICIMNKAVEWGHLPQNPLSRVKKEREDEKPMRILTAAEKVRLLEIAREDGQEAHTLITLALNTGLRRGDLLRLRMNAAMMREREIHLTMQKTRHAIHVPLNRAAESAIKTLNRGDDELLFPPRRADSKDSRWHYALWLKLANKAQLRYCRFHDLRHTFATDLLRRGVNIKVVKELLGHRSIQTTMRYLHFVEVDRRAAVDMLETAADASESRSTRQFPMPTNADLQNATGNLLETKWRPERQVEEAIA